MQITKSLRTDNGPNLVSKEIEDYLKEMGVEHRIQPLCGQGLMVK